MKRLAAICASRYATVGLCAGFLVFSSLSVLTAQRPPSPPPQAASGPGGAVLKHASVTRTRHGSGNSEYWLYEPAAPAPASAPLVVFLHGWSGTNPAIYGAWIDHLVRRGSVVVFPRYQADLRTPPRDFAPNAIGAIKDALRLLQSEP